MLKVGITGGIGSGKSVVCQVFSTLGIPVFYADEAARYLMEHDERLMNEIRLLFGEDVYINGKLDKPKVSFAIYSEPGIMEQLNALVHPATIKYAHEWAAKQDAPYLLKESALFFESGSNKEMDVMIGVSALVDVRIKRTMQRGNGMSEKQVEAIIRRQMNEDEKMKRCDHVIVNDDITPVLPQVLALHQLFLGRH